MSITPDTVIVQGSTTFAKLREAFLAALADADVSALEPGLSAWVEVEDPTAACLDGHFDIDLALRRALIATGLLVELT